MATSKEQGDLPDYTELDCLWGVNSIAKAARLSPRQANYLLANGKLPGKKIGRSWMVRRSQLDDFLRA
jgi:Helix-turn-helix domain